MIRESHATLLVGFSIAGGYRRPTAACKNSYHRLLSLQSGSSVWILPCGLFSGHRRLSHHRPPVEKSYWNQNFCIGWKNLKVAWEYLAETYLHVKLIVKLPCHNNVCTENTKHVKSQRSAAVAAIVFPPKWSTKITLPLMRARVLSSSTVKRPRMCFFFLRAYVSLYEHNSQTLSKASARGSIVTGSMPATAVLQNKRKKIKKFIER